MDLSPPLRTRRWGVATSRVVRRAMFGQMTSQVALGRELGVSQARISQVVHSFARQGIDLGSLSDTDRFALASMYVHSHRPEVTAEENWFSLDAPYVQADKVIAWAAEKGVDVALSADLAHDLVAPWRMPTLTVVYALEPLDLAALGFVPAPSRGEATVITRQVADRSLLEQWPSSTRPEYPVVHPLQQIWDLHDLGGEDREEAARRMIERLAPRDDALAGVTGAMG